MRASVKHYASVLYTQMAEVREMSMPHINTATNWHVKASERLNNRQIENRGAKCTCIRASKRYVGASTQQK